MIEYAGELVRPSIADAREKTVYNSLVGCGTYVFRCVGSCGRQQGAERGRGAEGRMQHSETARQGEGEIERQTEEWERETTPCDPPTSLTPPKP